MKENSSSKLFNPVDNSIKNDYTRVWQMFYMIRDPGHMHSFIITLQLNTWKDKRNKYQPQIIEKTIQD